MRVPYAHQDLTCGSGGLAQERRRELKLEPMRTPQPKMQEEGLQRDPWGSLWRGELPKGASSSLNVAERTGEDSQVPAGHWEGAASLEAGGKPGTTGGGRSRRRCMETSA